MPTDTFYIGISDDEVYDFFPLTTWFANYHKPVEPDWTFAPFSAQVERADGGRSGMGFPRATWTWNHRRNDHVEALRAICPGSSAAVYIRTPTNEVDIYGDKVWKTFSCQMLWMPEDEDKQAGYTLGFTLEFRRLVEVV